MDSPKRSYHMTDPMTPNHDQPVEGSRSDSYTSPDDGNVGGSDPAGSAASKATDVLEQLREAVEDFAEKATPVVRQFSAKAAEVVATAADKAVPLAHKAGEVTADASGKLAVKSRSWAADVRESLSSNGSTDPTDKTEPPTTI
jgi:hypothetical protein